MAHPLRDEVKDAILERLENGQTSGWAGLMQRYPDVPSSTFWRWHAEVRDLFRRSVPRVLVRERAERRHADALANLRETALLLKKHAFNAEGELVNETMLHQSAKWLAECASYTVVPKDEGWLHIERFLQLLIRQLPPPGSPVAAEVEEMLRVAYRGSTE
jgi:hypothetical protein